MRLALLAAAVPPLVMLLVACSDDPAAPEVSDAERPFVDALASVFTGSPEFPFSPEQAECVSATVVDTVGLDQLEASGVTPPVLAAGVSLEDLDVDLGDDEAEAIAKSFDRCDVGLADAIVSGMAQRGDALSEPAADCVRDEFDDGDFAELLARGLLDGRAGPSSELDAFFLDLADACPQLDAATG